MVSTNASRLSLTEWIVLGLVIEQPRHGFSIARTLQADEPLGKIWTVQRPLVYRALDRLHGLRLIEATRTEPGDQGPQRIVFRATRTGRTRFGRWLDQVVDHPRDARAELLAKFVFRARRGQPLESLAERQLEHFRPVTQGLEHAARDASGTDRLVALWRLTTIYAINSTLDLVAKDELVASATE